MTIRIGSTVKRNCYDYLKDQLGKVVDMNDTHCQVQWPTNKTWIQKRFLILVE